MRNSLLVYLFALISILQTKAQVYTPTGTIQGSSGNNNIGIGTSTPQGRIDVEGLVRLGWNPPYYGIGISSAGIGDGNWARRYGFYKNSDNTLLGGFGAAGGENALSYYWIGSDYNSYIASFYQGGPIIFNGNVGIGTTPYHKLHILGSDNIWGLFIQSPNTISQSNGFGMCAGTNSNDKAVRIKNAADNVEYFTIRGDGNIGIGTTSPYDKTTVSSSSSWLLLDGAYSSDPLISFGRFGNILPLADRGVAIKYIYTSADVQESGGLAFCTNPTMSGHNGLTERMRIMNNGYVGIGTSNPQNKLDVNGTIRAKEFIATLSNWPDYVFEKDYKIMNLAEVEEFIKKENRLPGIPSAADIEKSGIELASINKLLLKKIEELTLYSIEQNKKLIEQEERNIKIEQELEELRKIIIKNQR